MSRLAPAFLVVLFSACDSITESEDPDPVGTYELHSLDGNPVPYSFIDEYGDTIVVTQGTLFIGENLRFSAQMTGTDSALGNLDLSWSGSWSAITPTRIELRYEGIECVETGDVTHESITIDSDCDGFVWFWSRI